MLRSTLGAALVLALVASTAAAQSVQTGSPDDQARAHFRLGRAHYDNGQFLQAAAEFEAAHRISGRAALLYNVYLAYRDANDQPNAARSLRMYLELEKDVENRPQLEAKLKALEEGLAAAPAAAPAPAPPPVAVAPPPAQPQPAPAPQPAAAPPPTEPQPVADTAEPADMPEKSTNLLPWILMGSGGALIVGSIVTGVMARSAQGELEDECPRRTNCDPSLKDTQDRGETLALVTDILLFGGIAVAGTGAVLFILDQGQSDSADTTAAVACLPGACQGVVRGHF